ncbi:BolA family transcriptional regulator [Vibrio metoecus]|uniref:DNA-binding transcriptional regulator BolA n=1 Tax=Vibrio metoecus TaxID=1481663 RepID=A0A0Q0JBJ7_VIBMT|nr:BolA/IbaG family iron-sulfur metabolism protein [Vibrio metoecus]KQA17775.1 transcriptional regulator BolA [Vibrio metoecus]KQA24004.1 transcriptional regulator BolA [Vibrio metoecus]KQB00099.1 transcriptional regulator BolA [Vibrio metoecus]KQB01823.1 transcriptional regulator BolA [Vibrio metoecus]KQB09622.1 transcriptional regulator BolA [Vibrio metoecus]
MIQDVIEMKLRSELQPDFFKVINESDMHNVPRGSESHFKVTIVSDRFNGMRPVARHRLVNQTLADELANHIHALAIHTYTREEWQQMNKEIPESPMCLGGSRKSAQ